MLIQNIPVVGSLFRSQLDEVKIGTARVEDNKVILELSHETLDRVLELVQDGAEIKAFHINIELMAARKKEG